MTSSYGRGAPPPRYTPPSVGVTTSNTRVPPPRYAPEQVQPEMLSTAALPRYGSARRPAAGAQIMSELTSSLSLQPSNAQLIVGQQFGSSIFGEEQPSPSLSAPSIFPPVVNTVTAAATPTFSAIPRTLPGNSGINQDKLKVDTSGIFAVVEPRTEIPDSSNIAGSIFGTPPGPNSPDIREHSIFASTLRPEPISLSSTSSQITAPILNILGIKSTYIAPSVQQPMTETSPESLIIGNQYSQTSPFAAAGIMTTAPGKYNTRRKGGSRIRNTNYAPQTMESAPKLFNPEAGSPFIPAGNVAVSTIINPIGGVELSEPSRVRPNMLETAIGESEESGLQLVVPSEECLRMSVIPPEIPETIGNAPDLSEKYVSETRLYLPTEQTTMQYLRTNNIQALNRLRAKQLEDMIKRAGQRPVSKDKTELISQLRQIYQERHG